MGEIIGFIKLYFKEVSKPVLLVCTVFMGVLIWLNYGYDLEDRLTGNTGAFFPELLGRIILYSIAFFIPLLILLFINRQNKFTTGFWVCALLAPLLFAIKVCMPTTISLNASAGWASYWSWIIYWPLRLLVMGSLLALLYAVFQRNQPFFGLTAKGFKYRPYLLMLLVMLPLITAAATQPDFLGTYPKMKLVLPLPAYATPDWLYKVLFELSYGSDFVSIELFFRGFLVIGFARWAGKDAILPMACFYCSIHFGKPLGECISSYFGGLLLGIVSYHTRSIYGGLIVHLGIAWMMELAGTLGHYFKW